MLKAKRRHAGAELIRRRLMVVLASYRPELHYMRGRGPEVVPLRETAG